MANVRTNVGESVFTIKKWLGVNQALEGETRLKYGEAAEMRNFKITDGGALIKRGGSKNIAGLMASYNVGADTSQTLTLESETGKSDKTFTMYPRIIANSVGNVIVDGASVEVTYSGESSKRGYYCKIDSAVYKYKDCLYEASALIETASGVGYRCADYSYRLMAPVWSEPPVFHNGQWNVENAQVVNIMSASNNGKYVVISPSRDNLFSVKYVPSNGATPAVSEFELDPDGKYAQIDNIYWEVNVNTGWLVSLRRKIYSSAKYSWNFYRTTSTGNGADKEVRGIWSGFVGGSEVLCAACNGHLWQLTLTGTEWSKADCGSIDTSGSVFMFGFDENLYIMNGVKYYVWNGFTLSEVAGYRPLVSVAVSPSGGGTILEQVNKLCGLRRCRFSPDGSSVVFHLPETAIASVDYVKNLSTDTTYSPSSYTVNLAAGTVTFLTAPVVGVSNIEIGWTFGTNSRSSVLAMKFAELYNGAQNTRVFIYGDGGSKAFYSGLDYDGNPRADYFPDMNECAIGDSNTPITAMIRHYNKLLCFKTDSAWSISYDTLTLADGSVTAGFYITSVNRDIGNIAPGQAALVENRPRTLDSRSVVEWKATSSSGGITGDQRNAEIVSQRVRAAIYDFDLSMARTFYDKIYHEFYIIGANGIALVNNTAADVWYIYTDFSAKCIINYKDELYYGTADGYLRHFSNDYFSDEGNAIDAYWESGALDFGKDHKRKYSAMIWVGIKPEENGYLEVSAETDKKDDFADYMVSTSSTSGTPQMKRLKIKAKKFTYYKLILKNNTADKTATVVSADIRIRETGYVR